MRQWMLTSLATGLCALGFAASVQAGDTVMVQLSKGNLKAEVSE